jgi:hypothetical protein
MSIPTEKSIDKMQLLDQMLEDLAGDEIGEYSEIGFESYSSVGAEAKHFTSVEDFIAIDSKY